MKMRALFFALAMPILASAQVTRFDHQALRAKLMELKDHPPVSSIHIEGETRDPRKQAFLDYYVATVFPKFEARFKTRIKEYSLFILMDAYLHNSEAERQAWVGPGGEYEQVSSESNAWAVDSGWTEILKKWAELSEGLEGSLPSLARKMYRERELEVFPEELKPMLDEAARLEKDYMIAINNAPSSQNVREYRRRSTEIRRQFKTGEISFEEAQTKIHDLMQVMGLHFVGSEAVAAAGDNLNKMAVLRAKLAKAKGLNTWAAYALEVSGQGYTPEYRGPQNQRQFLLSYIRALRPLRDAFIETRIREMGLENRRSTLRQQHMSLLTPPGVQQLQPYFPAANMIEVWERTLLESGFKPEDLAQIVLDIEPRQGKNPTAAYMADVMPPLTGEEKINAETLDWTLEPKGSKNYKPGLVYILQNFGDAGASDLRTLFHEGGHGTERLLKFKTEPTDEAYGYVEVPSMTSERFASDPEVLWNKATPVNGHKPTMDEIKKLVANDEGSSILELLYMASTALFDLELWDYDYSADGAMTYLERVEFVSKKMDELTGELPDVETPVPFHLWNVTTSHFISGSVRNIGYTYAEIASRMMAKYFSDELEKNTGRRSWHNQPELVKLFADKFFEQGWRRPFPENIEAITGQKFSAEEVVREMAKELKGAGCESHLI